MEKIKVIECPRDGIQGLAEFIPTEDKIKYYNELLKLGFDTLDFGSFVSPKAIPQMKDTADVINGLDLSDTDTKLLAIVPNVRGGEMAVKYDKISYLGYPFSISNEFLKRNINTTMIKSVLTMGKLLDLCIENDKELVVYISMAFCNPYDEEWSLSILEDWVALLSRLGVKIIALSDTTGCAVPSDIKSAFTYLIPKHPHIEFGFHPHTTDTLAESVITAAYEGGCRRFDSVIGGIGGCPLSGYEMLGNLKTRTLLQFLPFHDIKLLDNINKIY